MQVFLLSLVRAEQGGRYVRLGARALPLPHARTSGRRTPPLDAGGYALAVANAEFG
jgi:hypothetical protein